MFSQYGEVRKVEPPAVGPRESVRYGCGRLSPTYSANGWARDTAVCRIHWTAASVMFQSLVITLFVDVSPTRSVTGRPSCLSRNGTSLVHASTRLLNNREVPKSEQFFLPIFKSVYLLFYHFAKHFRMISEIM